MTDEQRPCPCCQVARQHPTYRFFSPACAYCGARLIQRLGQLPIAASECKTRRQAVLKDWLEHGHSETLIRNLAAGYNCIGPESR